MLSRRHKTLSDEAVAAVLSAEVASIHQTYLETCKSYEPDNCFEDIYLEDLFEIPFILESTLRPLRKRLLRVTRKIKRPRDIVLNLRDSIDIVYGTLDDMIDLRPSNLYVLLGSTAWAARAREVEPVLRAKLGSMREQMLSYLNTSGHL